MQAVNDPVLDQPGLGSRVAIAEDERLVAKDLTARLTGMGFQVVGTASTGSQVVAIAERDAPDLVLMDIRLKGEIDGIDAAMILRQRFDLPTVYVTAHSDVATVDRAKRTEPLGYLLKPFNERDLRNTLVIALEKRRHERERERLAAEAREARLDAERATKAKDEFLAALSHELRTPMQVALGWLSLLDHGHLPSDRAQHAVAIVGRNVRHLAQVIDDLLDVARIAAGKLTLERSPTDLRLLMEQIVEAFTPIAQQNGITIVPEIAECGTVDGDPRYVRQIVTNLLSNAVKFSPRDTLVQVRTFADAGYGCVTVEDHGRGIDPAFLPHVFDRFRQQGADSTHRREGLGLGLAISKQLAELHEGTIEASSPGPGQGASFTLRLPFASAGLEPHQVLDSATGNTLNGISVLLVDDDDDLSELLEFVLKQRGASVKRARSVKEAGDRLAECLPDLVLTDFALPDGTGDELLCGLGTGPRHVATILLTGYGHIAAAGSTGFDLCLTKPIDPEQLVRSVARLTRADLAV